MTVCFTVFAFKLIAQSRLNKVIIEDQRESALRRVTYEMILLLTIYLAFHGIRSYLSYLMYTAEPSSRKITPLSYAIIGIEFVCFFIDIGVVLVFLVYFLEQRQNQRNSLRNQDATSLWDRWHFCMILTLLVAVDLARTCYRTVYMVSFDI
jgi:hypothetical protein